MITCRDCGSSQPEGTLFCSECGRYLLETAVKATIILPFSAAASHTSALPISEFKPEPFAEPKRLTFIIPNSRRRLEIDIIDQIRIGRADAHSGILLELNLVDDDGAALGVSRIHATIQAYNQGLAIIDLGSTNGTFLNNAPLTPQTPYPLNNGDEIRFGELLAHILF